MAALAFSLAVSVQSFGTEHVVTHSAKVVGQGPYKAAKCPVKATGKLLKFMF